MAAYASITTVNGLAPHRKVAKALLALRERLTRLTDLAPALSTQQDAMRALAEGYRVSAARRRSRGDEIGAHGDEACANEIAAQLADLAGKILP